jgi:hypothetical protein
MAQVFPEGPLLVVIQVRWHQRKKRLGSQHNQFALRARHGYRQTPGLQQEVTLAPGIGQIQDGC